jgi:hypothetical protein
MRVTTRMTFAASPAEVWSSLMFYEQIEARPPLHLRLLLPEPIATVGRKSEVGDEARCLYRSGHLVKRVTHIERERRYAFEVAEQALALVGGVRLAGGEYTLDALEPNRTQVTVATCYLSRLRPRWLWRPIEAALCHAFHRHILRAMRRDAESRRLGEPATTF